MTLISRPYLLLLVVYLLFLVGIATLADLGITTWVFTTTGRIPLGDKFGHMILAGLLSFLLNSALYCRATSLAGVRILTGSLMAYSLVLTEEFSQFWVASRHVEVYDVLSDIMGIYLFGLLASRNLLMKTGRA